MDEEVYCHLLAPEPTLIFARLQGCQPDVEVWQRILQVRTLVLNPEDDPMMWIKFANLCRKSERMVLADKTINSLLSPDRVSTDRVSITSINRIYPTHKLVAYEGASKCRVRATEVYVGRWRQGG